MANQMALPTTPGVDRDARLWNRFAKGYAKQAIGNPQAYEEKLARTQTYLTPESRVLEIGCGTGSTALVHAPHVRHILATDVSDAMIEIAEEKRVRASIGNVSFTRANARESLRAGEQYEAILALNLLHLLDDWQDVVRAASARLVEGGVFVTSTPCLAGRHQWLRVVAPLGARVGLIPRIRFLHQGEVLRALSAAGFVIEEAWQADRRNGLFVVARKRHEPR